MQVTIIPCLSDNYAYLLTAEGSRDAVVVDPSEAEPVQKELDRQGLRLVGILCTHHHVDHVGGNRRARLASPRDPGLRLRVRSRTHPRTVGVLEARGGALDRGTSVPGTAHSWAHARRARLRGARATFTGDTLFASGCGRLFEGTPAMMYESLNVTLAKLPTRRASTAVHEYTASNLKFAAHVEPGNQAVKSKAARVAALRAEGKPTVPSTLADERATNPFMRCDSAEIIAQRSGAPR